MRNFLIIYFCRPYSQAEGTSASPRGTTLPQDEAAQLPEEGIAPGTRWEDVPADCTCPDCATDKSGFERIES
jgi:rubredoxin